MKVLVVGCGNIGSVAAEDLAKSMKSVEVIVADYDKAKAKAVADRIGTDNVSWIQLDVTNQRQLTSILKDFSLIMGFLPGQLGYGFAEACIEAGKDLVDVSYMAENPLTLNDKAVKAGVAVIPDCGLAPGISNVLVGHAAADLDKTATVHIMVGGLPEKPVPPLGYIITWSPESLIDEYTRKAGIVKKGKRVEIEALSGIEEIEFPGIGKLEAFYTDGLRTLAHTIKAENMWEKTLRYPGHAEKIKAFDALGFFDEKKIDIDGAKIAPRRLAVKLLAKTLQKPEVKDIVALKVEVSGVKNSKKAKLGYHMLDHYDPKRKLTAMARTTAFPASITAQLILKRAMKTKGVVPPEKIGMDRKLFHTFVDELGKRGIHIAGGT
jgi:saccharopine dehydrogenase-like NADP-dependent oxidoreductase